MTLSKRTIVQAAFVGSIIGNLLSVAVIVHLLAGRASSDVQESVGEKTRNASLEHAKNSPPVSRAIHAGVQFDWRQIESEDYEHYIANLRLVGCPEKTIRDIIIADVNELFTSRRSILFPNDAPDPFWSDRLRAATTSLNGEKRVALQELAAQKRAVLKQLLGVDASGEDWLPEFLNPFPGLERRFAFLPEDKRRSYLQIMVREAEALQHDPSPEERSIVQRQARLELEALLSPHELYELDLRESIPAAKLRGALDQVDPTEEEFRAVFDQWRKLDTARLQGASEYLESLRQSEIAILQILGPERFPTYLAGSKAWGYGR